MRRDRIVEAVNNLSAALQAAQIREVLRIGRSSQQSEDQSATQKALMAYSIFSQHHIDFGEEEKQLMSLFGLNPLINVNFWSGLLENNRGMSQKLISDVDIGVYNVVYILPKMCDLLIRETDKNGLFVKLQDGLEREVQRLRVFIAEKKNALTDTAVVSDVIRSVDDFYENLCFLHKSNYVSLSIGSIDSGSAKCLDFFGAADVVNDMNDILSSVWHQVKHASQENIRYQIEVALMSAGFVARINNAQKSKTINEEDGKRISRLVAKSIENMLRNGAYTAEMDRAEETRASQLLERRTDLLEYLSEQTLQSDTEFDVIASEIGPRPVEAIEQLDSSVISLKINEDDGDQAQVG